MYRLVVACTAFVGAAVLAACSGDKDPTPVAVAVTQAGGNGALTLSGPDTIESGAVEIRFQNQAQAPVVAQVVGVEGTHDADEVAKVLGGEGEPTPPWLTFAGGVGATPPGQTATATLELDEGSYYLIGQARSEGDSGPPPATKTLRVSGDGGASLPSAGTTITTGDYSFAVGKLEAGANEIRFENDGKQPHEIVAAPIAQGRAIADVRTFFQTEGEPTGPPPVDFQAAAQAVTLDPGKALVTTFNLRAGKYAFVCFVPDREGGPPHFAKGMLQEVTVG